MVALGGKAVSHERDTPALVVSKGAMSSPDQKSIYFLNVVVEFVPVTDGLSHVTNECSFAT